MSASIVKKRGRKSADVCNKRRSSNSLQAARLVFAISSLHFRDLHEEADVGKILMPNKSSSIGAIGRI